MVLGALVCIFCSHDTGPGRPHGPISGAIGTIRIEHENAIAELGAGGWGVVRRESLGGALPEATLERICFEVPFCFVFVSVALHVYPHPFWLVVLVTIREHGRQFQNCGSACAP